MNSRRKISIFRSAHWMLLGLALALGASFWIGSAKFGKKVEDTYLDPHRLAALKTFEQAIEFAVPGKVYPALTAPSLRDKFPLLDAETLDGLAADLQKLNAKLKALSLSGKPLHFNLERWQPAESSVQADEAIKAAHWLAQGQRLEKLDWPGLRRAKASTAMQVPDSVFRQDNPWRGADGCIYLHPASGSGWLYLDERRNSKDICPDMAEPMRVDMAKPLVAGISRKPEGQEKGKDDPAWGIPDDLGLLLSGLDRVRSPTGAAYQEYTRLPEAVETKESLPPLIKGGQGGLDAQTIIANGGKSPLTPLLQRGEPDKSPLESTSNPSPHGPNRIRLHDHEIDVGFNVFLTINPAMQALAQRWAHCYTGDRAVCDGLGLDARDSLQTMAAEMYENAAMRMAAVAVVDVASGRIEALGSAHTACYKQDHSGMVHGKECPDAPFRPRFDTDRLYNHALYVDAMPASTVKPIMALAFLMDNPAYRNGPALQDLWLDLKTSKSEDFLDRLFCGDTAPRPPWQWQDCHRPQKTQEVANALGWNLGCSKEGSADCARLDVLFGRPSSRWPMEGTHPIGLDLLYGRFFTEPPEPEEAVNTPVDDWAKEDTENNAGGFHLIQTFRFDENFAKACSRGDYCPECEATHKRWRRCRGGAAGKLVNEGWGQGEARVIPLAVAGMMSRLAAAANGAEAQAFPHLVDHVGDAKGLPIALAVQRYAVAEPIAITSSEGSQAIDPALAKLVLQGMGNHQSGGTAHSACMNVFGKAAVCESMDWIAGKTGTPPFRFDDDALPEIRKHCYANDGKPKTECNLMPYKWYVAAFKTSAEPNAPYDKAIAVLSERNWRKNSGLVQAPGDRDVNLSAELALRIIKTMHPPVQALPQATKKKAKP